MENCVVFRVVLRYDIGEKRSAAGRAARSGVRAVVADLPAVHLLGVGPGDARALALGPVQLRLGHLPHRFARKPASTGERAGLQPAACSLRAVVATRGNAKRRHAALGQSI